MTEVPPAATVTETVIELDVLVDTTADAGGLYTYSLEPAPPLGRLDAVVLVASAGA